MIRRAAHTVDDRVTAYVAGVRAGEIVVGRLARLAVERHVRDLDGLSDHRFDAEEANFAIGFIECLRQSKGEWANQPLRLEPWQAFIVASLFGWLRADGKRRFRTSYIEVARKNGKSTLAAAIGHKLFVGDGEEGAEVYTAATKRDQARIVHEEAKRMARKSPGLRKLGVRIYRDNLSLPTTNSKYEPLGKDADTMDGLHIHGAIVDEIHVHPTRGVWDSLETATGSRTQPLLFGITTAGEGGNRESICWELRDYSRKVLEGIVDDPTWFAYVAALDEARYDPDGKEIAPADDWTDERNWVKANPNLGVSVKLDDMRRKFKKAIETPAAQANFKRKHLNMWVESLTAWLPAGLWDACRGAESWYGPGGLLESVRERYRDCQCWVGGDLSGVDDLTALVFAFRRGANGNYGGDGMDVIPACWCPRNNAEGRSRNHRVPYLAWAKAGELMLTEGDSVDYQAVRQFLRRARDEWGWDIQEIAFDPHNARYLQSMLIEDGFRVVDHGQGIVKMTDPIKQTQRLILERQLRHGGHRPLAWCVSNIVAYTDTNANVKFNKKASGDKIDIAVAMVMAVGRAIDRKAQSAYDHPSGFYADDFLGDGDGVGGASDETRAQAVTYAAEDDWGIA